MLITILSLAVIMVSGYVGDDSINSLIKGALVREDKSLLELTLFLMNQWFKKGRIFPIAFYVYGLFYYVSSLAGYKLLIIMSICLNVFFTGILVEKIMVSKKARYTCMICMSLFFQIYTSYHNPILSYHMLIQTVFSFILLSCLSLFSYNKTQKKRYIIVSYILWLMALLTYEVAFVFIIPIIILGVFLANKNKKKLIKSITPYIAIWGIVLGLNIILRMLVETEYQGTSISFDMIAIIPAFFKQLIASIPLSNYFFSILINELNYNISQIIQGIRLQDLILIISWIIIFNLIQKEYRHEKKIEIGECSY